MKFRRRFLLSDDEHVKYIPELKQKGLVTPQYEDWLKGLNTQESQDEPSKEVKRLRAIIKAKDRKFATEEVRQSSPRDGRET